MADLVITPASVVSLGNATIKSGLAGEAISAGQLLYRKTLDRKYYKAQCDATAEEAAVEGIAVNSAAINQPVDLQSEGDLETGAVTVKTTSYVLSAAPGMMCPQADLIAGNRIVHVAYAKNTTGTLGLRRTNTGVTV